MIERMSKMKALHHQSNLDTSHRILSRDQWLNLVQRRLLNQSNTKKMDPARSKNYDDELEKIPHYMRERVAYLIDQKVERRVREFMEEFR